jgi:hypothetical protein
MFYRLAEALFSFSEMLEATAEASSGEVLNMKQPHV